MEGVRQSVAGEVMDVLNNRRPNVDRFVDAELREATAELKNKVRRFVAEQAMEQPKKKGKTKAA